MIKKVFRVVAIYRVSEIVIVKLTHIYIIHVKFNNPGRPVITSPNQLIRPGKDFRKLNFQTVRFSRSSRKINGNILFF
jgi:hypothetical protein